MKKLLYLSFLFLAFLCSCSSQKTDINTNPKKTLTGYVFAEGDVRLSMPNVKIQVKGVEKERFTTPDINGDFEIEVRKDEILIISYLSFHYQEVRITDEDFKDFIIQIRDKNEKRRVGKIPH